MVWFASTGNFIRCYKGAIPLLYAVSLATLCSYASVLVTFPVLYLVYQNRFQTRFTVIEKLRIGLNKFFGVQYDNLVPKKYTVFVPFPNFLKFKCNLTTCTLTTSVGRMYLRDSIQEFKDSCFGVDQFLRFPADTAAIAVSTDAFVKILLTLGEVIDIPDDLKLEMPLNLPDYYEQKRKTFGEIIRLLGQYLNEEACVFTHAYTWEDFEKQFGLQWK